MSAEVTIRSYRRLLLYLVPGGLAILMGVLKAKGVLFPEYKDASETGIGYLVAGVGGLLMLYGACVAVVRCKFGEQIEISRLLWKRSIAWSEVRCVSTSRRAAEFNAAMAGSPGLLLLMIPEQMLTIELKSGKSFELKCPVESVPRIRTIASAKTKVSAQLDSWSELEKAKEMVQADPDGAKKLLSKLASRCPDSDVKSQAEFLLSQVVPQGNSVQLRDALGEISIRGRVALAARCLELATDQLELNSDRWEQLLAIVWRFTSTSMLDQWEEDVTDASPESHTDLAVFFHDARLSSDDLQLLSRMLDGTIEVGRANLYAGVVGHSEETLRPLIEDVVIPFQQLGGEVPELTPFERSEFTERDGWGHSVLREFFIPTHEQARSGQSDCLLCSVDMGQDAPKTLNDASCPRCGHRVRMVNIDYSRTIPVVDLGEDLNKASMQPVMTFLQRSDDLVLNASTVNFFESSAASSIFSLHRSMQDAGRKLVICGLNPHLMEVFQMLRLDKMLELCPDEDAAITSLR